jgi:hypothetical protein
MLIPDPCGSEPGYKRLVAYFIENLMLDCNYRLATVQGYTQSINKLFEYHSFPIPVDLSDKENIFAKLLHTRECEDAIARCRSPITKEMFVAIAQRASELD